MTKTTNHTSTLTTQLVANSVYEVQASRIGVSDNFGNGFNITSTALGLIRVMTNAAKKTNVSAKSQ